VYAEKLFQNKKGAVVAIEPTTGEVLSILSAPTYDPSLLVGRVRGANYAKLQADTLKTLFNRALYAKYPPGSTFKPINILIGLQEGAINLSSRFFCAGRSSTPIKCTHNHISPASVVDAVRESCNPYLWNTFRAIISMFNRSEEGFNVWRDYLVDFGLGQIISTDFNASSKGDLPSQSLYDNIYGRGHWNALTIRSLAIGQGELGVTPIQLANCGAILANRGHYFEPHIVKEIENDTLRSSIYVKHETGIDDVHFDPVYQGMMQVARGRLNRNVPGIDYCGKTGTIQNPHGQDHSAYVAFAPAEDPKIAIMVYVENGGYGATYAAPMASLMIEKYLNDTISTQRLPYEKQMIEANLLATGQP
jgi:penicillin-binding protein 2